MTPSSDPARQLLRHTLATVAYRGGKTLRDAPAGFADFRAGERTRTPLAILSHVADLYEWGGRLARGDESWDNPPRGAWDAEVDRFFANIGRLDALLAGDEPLACSATQLFQGPIADSL